MEEKVIWEGNPSQWVNVWVFLFCGIFFWLIIPVFIIVWNYLLVKKWDIKITDQRIIEEKGILSKTIEETELYRVKDIRLEQPFILRLVGLSNLLLITSDPSHPKVIIPAIKDGKLIREKIRLAVDQRRDKKLVRETDFS